MTMPTYFISHGGGPWPWMPEAQTMYAPLRAALQDIPRQLGRTPKAILMVSAHWEAQQANLLVASAAQPSMVYDYYGFPSHTYEIHYPAPGDPALAQQVCNLLETAGLPTHLDAKRGFDHGTFAPAYVMYPKADVPMMMRAWTDIVGIGTKPLAALSNAPLDIKGHGSIPSIKQWIPNLPAVTTQFGILIPKGVPQNVIDTVTKLWNEKMAKSPQLATWAEDRGALMTVLAGKAAEDAVTPTVVSSAWMMHAAGLTKASPETIGIPPLGR